MQTRLSVFIDDIKKNTTAFFTSASPALFFAFAAVFPFLKNTLTRTVPVTDFSEHINSQASAHNIDIGARINGYYLMLLLAVVLFIGFGLLLFKLLKNKTMDGQTKAGFRFVTYVSTLGALSLVTAILLNYRMEEFLLVIGVFLIPLFLGLLFILFDKNAKRSFNMLVFSLAMGVVLAIPAGVVLLRLNLSNDLYPLAMIVVIGAIALINYVLTQTVLSQYKDRLIAASIPLLFSALAQSALLETLNILNKRFNIVLNIQYVMYGVILAICAGLSILIWIKQEKTKSKKDLVYKLFLPIVVLTVGVLIAQPLRMVNSVNEYFEYANHGLAIHQFFNYGTLPIIESFDAHMLNGEFFGYISGLLNGYEVWAEGLYQGLYIPIYALLVFTLLKKIIGDAESFVFVLGFPLLRMVFYEAYIIPVIMLLAIAKLIKTDKMWQRTVFIITCVVLCLYRLDIGFSAVIAGVLAYCLVNINRKEVKRIGTLALAGAISLLILGGVFFVLCTIKGISPILRAKEFLIAAGSSQNWAYAQTGDKTTVVYNLVYYIMPLNLFAVTAWFIYNYYVRDRKEGYDKTQITVFLFFVIFYFVNLSRGIVRHSLMEQGNIWFISSTYFLSLISLTAVKTSDEKRLVKFASAVVASILIISIGYPSLNSDDVKIPNINRSNHSLTHYALNADNYKSQYDPQQPMNGTRVYADTPEAITQFKTLLDSVLTDDQTYADAASLNYLYALTDRKNPFYINQVPLMLNGDSGQRMAVNQLKNADAPIAILPIPNKNSAFNVFSNGIDGIALDYKYYKIYEYVYQTYIPLVRIGEIDVYCLPELHDSYIEKIGGTYERIDTRPEVWSRRVGYLPLLWGEKDKQGIFDNALMLGTAVKGVKTINSKPFSAVDVPVNLVMTIDSSANQTANMTLIADGQMVSDYAFYLASGTHRYAVRISSDYHYWAAETLAVQIEFEGEVDMTSISLIDDQGISYPVAIE